jgi:hypothetical protein
MTTSPPADHDVADESDSADEPATARLDSEAARRSSRLDPSKSSATVPRRKPPATPEFQTARRPSTLD